MLIDQYCTVRDGRLSFTREQGSDFAKRVADDFNPLHDPDAKRFCIPGDLLFAVVLSRYGLSQHMEFLFSGMVVDGVELVLPPPSPQLLLDDTQGRHYLSIRRGGDNAADPTLIDNLTRGYVAFSGHTFPHILVPLLAGQNVMLNPDRPTVIYQSMTIDLDRLDIASPVLASDRNELSLNGKRGEVLLAFNLVEGGEVVGRGCKRMIVSGLREYDRAVMDATVAQYNAHKQSFAAP